MALIPLFATGTVELGVQLPPNQTVWAVAKLISSEANFPENYEDRLNAGKKPGDFDPNRFFFVLKHLSMEPGFVLDYVYAYDYAGGYPLLYALRSGAQPIGSSVSPEEARPAPDPFLHVRTDGTPEGFFELTVLRIMGEQFYLFWHANYNDLVPLCGKVKPVDKTATVSLLIFTKWGGRSRETYEYQRSFPHKLMKYDSKVLFHYNCRVEF